MIKSETAVGRFFEVYARESNSNDIPAIVSHFADPFLVAGPAGTQCLRAAEFAAALTNRKQLFERLGARPASLMSFQETALDAPYVIAKTRWEIEFVREDRATTQLLVDSTFLIHTGTNAFRIVMYMPHQDIMQVMKNRGIL